MERPRGDDSEGEWTRVLSYEYVLATVINLPPPVLALLSSEANVIKSPGRLLTNNGGRESLIKNREATLHIDLLPEFQRKGYGKKLIGEFEKAVKELGAKGIHVVVAGENDKVVAFYEKCGFGMVGGGEVEGNVFLGKSL